MLKMITSFFIKNIMKFEKQENSGRIFISCAIKDKTLEITYKISCHLQWENLTDMLIYPLIKELEKSGAEDVKGMIMNSTEKYYFEKKEPQETNVIDFKEYKKRKGT